MPLNKPHVPSLRYGKDIDIMPGMLFLYASPLMSYEILILKVFTNRDRTRSGFLCQVEGYMVTFTRVISKKIIDKSLIMGSVRLDEL